MTGKDTDKPQSERMELATDIGALMDGEFSDSQRHKLESRLFKDQEARDLFRGLAHDNELLRKAVPSVETRYGSADLEAVIEAGFSERENAARRKRVAGRILRQTAAAAILIAGTFGVTSIWMQKQVDTEIAGIAARMEKNHSLLSSAIQEVLETRISGEVVRVVGADNWAGTLTPISTYKSTSGHWCREYLRETNYGTYQPTIRGTACRNQDGIWTTLSAEPSPRQVLISTGT